ncbi:Nitrogen assimilation transcription factor-like protein [Hapsidospora chrysogenum ATCC 11550]|uniref:Nitrogen assimilation transcription factor-like protein n=1 Tax=Hapsidospora chrysogenum (strain ATCC 11550 / CBS 779.69 / DSM 880 / IAM 14645 / JCM 23072 / IMI 49137) TaxID=857340 RepID=A0A086T6Q4_HAPC1|nr:Nitrogen assimilation transcription factor-like protein [Hapsidospora chrysogenum ATCC 11550]
MGPDDDEPKCVYPAAKPSLHCLCGLPGSSDKGEGQSACDRCIKTNKPCVIRDDDQRKTPFMRGRMRSLMKRIGTLEQTLVDAGLPVPADVQEDGHAPQSSSQEGIATDTGIEHGGQSSDSSTSASASAPLSSSTAPSSLEPSWASENGSDCLERAEEQSQTYCPPIAAGSQTMATTRFRAGRGSISTARPRIHGGRSRYFGITTNFHIYSDLYQSEMTAKSEAMNEQASRFLERIPGPAHGYLMECFWECYNLVMPVVYKEAFEMDRAALGRDGTYYSGLLHICMLAIGFRYADRTKYNSIDMFSEQRNRESSFHKEAKKLVEHELKMPGGVPSIQALILLGDLECGIGKYNTGWLYAGMASRLCFDLGLHRDMTESSSLTKLERQVRTTTLWVCVTIDRYWGLFLGRPTSIKLSDISLGPTDRPMRDCYPMGVERTLEAEIYEALTRLMELASRLTEISSHVEQQQGMRPDPTSYYRAAGLDQELRDWYHGLDEHLKWSQARLESAPPAYFFLHQQYHTLFILLYRSFIPEGGYEDHPEGGTCIVQQVAGKTCFTHAIEVARIIKAYRQRFEMRTMFVTGMQHATTAALAIVENLSTAAAQPKSQSGALLHLQCLAEALYANAASYFPAKVMSEILSTVINEYRARGENPAMGKQQAAGPGRQIPGGAALECFNSTSGPAADGSQLGVLDDNIDPNLGVLESTAGAWMEAGEAAVPQWNGETDDALGTMLGGDGFPVQGVMLDSEIWESIMNTLSQPLED